MPRRDGSIRLHPEHGLNPTLAVCFWCGKDRGEIALLGAAYKGEAPMHMVLDYEPCAACKAGMAGGITFVECSPAGDKRRPIAKRDGKEIAPTGRWLVVKAEAIERMGLEPELLAGILEHRKAYVDPEAFEMLFVPAMKEGRDGGQG
jgi:hypothetical protein